MYTNVSNDFIAALSRDSRTFRARITAENETVTNIISYALVAGSCGREAFCPGTVFSSYVDLVLPASEISLSGREFLLETGILLDDDTVEYVPMGYYVASPSDIAASRDQVTVKAYDRIKNKCGDVYEPSVTFPTTIWNVLNDLSYQAGIVILTSCTTTGIVDTAMNGLTVAETLGYIAGLLGGFCWADRAGNIRIDPFPQTSVLQVEKSRIMSLSTSVDEYELTGITVMVPPVRTESEEDPEEIAYTTGSGTKLVLSNPYMTETLFSSMAASLIGYSFYPGSIRFLGDPRLDPVDAITAVNYADDTFLIPCMEINQGFDGGLVTTVSAPGLNVSDEGARGPLTQTLIRLGPDINQAKIAAKRAVHIAGNTAQHFWHTEEGTDTGVHITEIPKEEFLEAPSNGGGNLLARSNGIAVRDGLVELATFGTDGTQIGQSGQTRSNIDYHSMRLIDKNGNNYFYVSDMRDRDGKAQITDTFIGNGDDTFWLTFTATSTDYTVTVSDGTGGSIYKENNRFRFSSEPAADATITATYETESDEVKAYTIGLRGTGDVGASSVIVGTRCVASGKYSYAEGRGTTTSGWSGHAEGFETTVSGSVGHAEGYGTTASGYCSHAQNISTTAGYDYQTVIGQYNHNRSNNAFEIGNGFAALQSNAFEVDWNGTAKAKYRFLIPNLVTGEDGIALRYGTGDTPSSGIWSIQHQSWLARFGWDGKPYVYDQPMYVQSRTINLPSTFAASNVMIRRYAAVVTIIVTNVTKAAVGENLIHTLPEGWRPPAALIQVMANPQAGVPASGALSLRMQVNSEGKVVVYNYRSTAISSATNQSGYITYIATQ